MCVCVWLFEWFVDFLFCFVFVVVVCLLTLYTYAFIILFNYPDTRSSLLVHSQPNEDGI